VDEITVYYLTYWKSEDFVPFTERMPNKSFDKASVQKDPAYFSRSLTMGERVLGGRKKD
jgi:hypothetical protein